MFYPVSDKDSLEDPRTLFDNAPRMVLGGEPGLESCTFGRIKAILSQEK